MNYIFYFLIVISIIAGALNCKLSDVVNSILTGAELSVKVAFSLIGIMAFWLGMMQIAEKCGLVALIAKIIKPVTKILFNEIPENSPAVGDIAMSFSANAFGLTNAATPIGIKAMEELQKDNVDKTSASNAMCMFLAMNTAGFQIIPATVIAVLVGIGYPNPTEIIAPTLIVTATAFFAAIFMAKVFQRLWITQKEELGVRGEGLVLTTTPPAANEGGGQ
jgi:spore maturation protein A